MIVRRVPILALTVLALIAVAAGASDTLSTSRPLFSRAAVGWMPYAPTPGALTESWFCPGVPATAADGVEGAIVIVNRSGERRVGSVLLYNERAENRRLGLDIEPWATATVDVDATLPGAMVGALIEVEGGGVIAEQQSLRPSGNSSTACANATSDTWFFADGSTAEGSLDQIVLSNPYDHTVVASLEFATREGPRTPGGYNSLTVQARSTRVIDLGAPGAGAQGEPLIAVGVRASVGRLVVARSQWFLGGGRLGTQVSLASPAPRNMWWFANGEHGGDSVERYAIYNPSDDDVEVDVIVLGVDVPLYPEPIAVQSKRVEVFDPSQVDGFPTGGYTIVLSTLAEESIVVERATTQVLGDQVGASVLPGAVSRPDGYYATSWYVVQAPVEPTEGALAIHNADNSDGTVTVSVLGSSGPVAVPSLTDVPLRAAQRLELDLTDQLVLGRPLVVEATNRVFVERWFPAGRGDLRVASWAIPAA